MFQLKQSYDNRLRQGGRYRTVSGPLSRLVTRLRSYLSILTLTYRWI